MYTHQARAPATSFSGAAVTFGETIGVKRRIYVLARILHRHLTKELPDCAPGYLVKSGILLPAFAARKHLGLLPSLILYQSNNSIIFARGYIYIYKKVNFSTRNKCAAYFLHARFRVIRARSTGRITRRKRASVIPMAMGGISKLYAESEAYACV